MDPIKYIATSLIVGALGCIVLYLVIKAAVKNALIEDGAFQAKVKTMMATRRAQPRHLDADGA
ncbi:hypothetical protein ACPW96_20220 [Micromonospora sp. DT81.3]|uniref:hypothetical protein n=1 Tax=Micromonospora sp. DT81.3 TaxID=3416523 RepID=UPI003CFB2758